MTGVSIIGAGRLGASLGHALVRRGYELRAVSCRSLRSARESARIAGAGRAFTDIVKAAGDSGTVFLCVTDRALPEVAAALASSSLDWRNRTVFHTSGLVSSRVLEPLAREGAHTASFHPAQTFARKEADPGLFKGIFFGLEGEPAAVKTALSIARRLGGSAILLDEKDKVLYHAACVVCSAGGTAVFDAASRLLAGTGLERDLAARVLMPLAEKSLRNVKELGATAAFTGPISRGDVQTVRSHFKALPEKGPARRLYTALGLAGLETVGKGKLSLRAARALKRLLEDR
jgi:predicted short-subunit dehydrogenase-like oxidoreductase (DUF2520 family)